MKRSQVVKRCILIALLLLFLFNVLSGSLSVTTRGVDPGPAYGISL
ncbi:hypothetical protein RLC84_06530 [Streptococcus pneumoniae]|uniref:Uncharacterized protein n=1 Tax=Streptococcus parapneumoniae TaxID=2993430 RepID=A0ABM8CIS3_9STRE|nr:MULTISPECIES: hypothetical protein [Streptococcus]BDT65376.1 hypothetical protein SP4011_17930 [Streptococcus sp. SP4011]MDS5453572.1 hypothetical protein [Streptococcus pneumoniae]MDS5726832.1 hypothetical protein [Streptococcus pneumoniae]CIY29418.1 Uncharacterised protein [Streptococcus pneumoniae]COA21488.1 Uncharacterised protein [Streptococcus pneumoniae]